MANQNNRKNTRDRSWNTNREYQYNQNERIIEKRFLEEQKRSYLKYLADNAIDMIQNNLEEYEQDVKAIDLEKMETMQRIRQAACNGTPEEFQELLDTLTD